MMHFHDSVYNDVFMEQYKLEDGGIVVRGQAQSRLGSEMFAPVTRDIFERIYTCLNDKLEGSDRSCQA